jgi:hypothetical protein
VLALPECGLDGTISGVHCTMMGWMLQSPRGRIWVSGRWCPSSSAAPKRRSLSSREAKKQAPTFSVRSISPATLVLGRVCQSLQIVDLTSPHVSGSRRRVQYYSQIGGRCSGVMPSREAKMHLSNRSVKRSPGAGNWRAALCRWQFDILELGHSAGRMARTSCDPSCSCLAKNAEAELS